jgi:hypothetical protein
MLIVNFAHPLTEQQLESVRALVKEPIAGVKSVACQFDPERPFVDQTRALLDEVGLSAEEWQTTALLLNLPSLAPIVAVVLAEVHGRTGFWPPVLRMRPVAGVAPPRFEVAEVVDLNKVREEARKRRGEARL